MIAESFLHVPKSFLSPLLPGRDITFYPERPLSLAADLIVTGYYILILVLIFYSAGAFLGALKEKFSLPAGITRKLFCMTIFSLGFIVPELLKGIPGRPQSLAVAFATIVLILTLSLPLRERIPFCLLTFRALEREGEGSKTVLWLWTEATAAFLIVFIGSYLLRGAGAILLIPALASGLSDSAAEIVGGRWGKHKYPVVSFLSEKKFHRSMEGSLAFFFMTCSLSAGFYLFQEPDLSHSLCLLLLPFILTLAEALAPHSWDNPFIYLAGQITIGFFF